MWGCGGDVGFAMSDKRSTEHARSDTVVLGLESASRAATLVTSVAVLLSVVYNWAYFVTLSRNTLQLLTISDHLRSALVWFPSAVILVCLPAAAIWISVRWAARSTTRKPPGHKEADVLYRRQPWSGRRDRAR
jgi:hypothetical protein